jgi:outer membrane protein assembly factor BamE (lipoprotein component of BamABCDE complex)
MKSICFDLAAACLLIAVAGCETAADRIDPELVQTIKPGITTRQEVLKQFGSPRETLSSGGRTLLFYERDYRAWVTRYGPISPARLVCLSVLFDRNDRVIRTNYSSHNLTVHAGAVTASAGSPVSEKMLARIHANITTRKEAIEILGEPGMETLALDGHLVMSWPYIEADYAGGGSSRLKNASLLQLAFDNADVVAAIKTVNRR